MRVSQFVTFDFWTTFQFTLERICGLTSGVYKVGLIQKCTLSKLPLKP